MKEKALTLKEKGHLFDQTCLFLPWSTPFSNWHRSLLNLSIHPLLTPHTKFNFLIHEPVFVSFNNQPILLCFFHGFLLSRNSICFFKLSITLKKLEYIQISTAPNLPHFSIPGNYYKKIQIVDRNALKISSWCRPESYAYNQR